MTGRDRPTTGGRRGTALPVVARPGWKLGQHASVVGLVVVMAGLFVFPAFTATLFWWGIVPVLPVLFLIHPSIWRNVCPLATLSIGGEPEGRLAGAASEPSPWAGAAGVLPFFALVAWRGTGLEARPLEAGGVLLAVTAFAVVAGRRGIRRDGFCNRYCPLLPIERTYGQSPLADVHDTRCPSCTLCTPRGCLDLSATAAAPQLLGPRRHGADWLLTPYGAFVAALPGFIAAYFLAPTAGSTAPNDLIRFAGALTLGAVASWTSALVLVRVTRAAWSVALPTLAATAAALYYLFATPRAEEAWGWNPMVTPILQGVVLLVVGVWWVRALRRGGGSKVQRTG